MDSLLVGLGSALWLGILTSISPCPLATNIAAMSFIGRRVEDSRKVFASGLLYTAGRMLVYVALEVIIVSSLMSISEISLWLQEYMNKLLGPVLILVGMVLIELISIPVPGGSFASKMQNRAEAGGVWGAGLGRNLPKSLQAFHAGLLLPAILFFESFHSLQKHFRYVGKHELPPIVVVWLLRRFLGRDCSSVGSGNGDYSDLFEGN